MTKYQLLLQKIQIIKKRPDSNFNSSELELITEALETIQFLEIIFKAKNKK